MDGRIPFDVIADLRWWKSTLSSWDGIYVIEYPVDKIEIWSDAATSGCLAAHLGPRESCIEAFAAPIPAKDSEETIMYLETLALLLALEKWADKLRRCRVICKIDDQVLVAAISSGTVRNPRMQTLIRRIYSIAMAKSLTLVPKWIPSAENEVADALSRHDYPFLNANYLHVITLVPRFPDTSPILRIDAPPSQPVHGTILDADAALDSILSATSLDDNS